MNLRALIVGLGIILLAAPAEAATYYVDPQTGANTNNGTAPSTPWQNPPGTRNITDTGFYATSWGAITTSNKIKCGDTILLKGGSTQASAQGGAWRIDNGPNGGDTPGYYTLTCTYTTPITIRVATNAEWLSSTGNFTIDGTGVPSACLAFCGAGGRAALVSVQDVNGLVIGGNNSSQRLIIQHAQPGAGGIGADGLLLASSNGGSCPSCAGGQLTGIVGQWLELASNNWNGLETARLSMSRFAQILSHDNGYAGINTGAQNDYLNTAVGFEDVETSHNGTNQTVASRGDEFLFLGCQSCFLVRGKSHDGLQRALNFGQVSNTSTFYLLIRDGQFYDNGSNTDPNQFRSGPCWSGADNRSVFDMGIMERSIVYHNHEAGGPCAYGTGWAEVWNSVFFNNGWDTSMAHYADIEVAVDNNHLAVYNSISPKRPSNYTWGDDAPRGNVLPSLCPVSDYNLYVPVGSNSETLSNFNCTGSGSFASGAQTYVSPPSFIGAHDKVGSAYRVGFVATNDSVYANNNFSLTAGSSAIDAGTYMMRANGGGTGTTVNVLGNGGSNDPRLYFIGPVSYLGATADTIQIKSATCTNAVTDLGSAERARIISMTATAITLDRSCTWADGAGIHLPWTDTAPDMGALEYIPPSPSSLPGDLDGNGVVDILDLQLMVNVLLGTETTPAIVARADLNGDGTPTILDLQRLVNLLLGV